MSSSTNQIYSVTSLTQEIKKTLTARFSSVQVKGEVTNIRKQQSGHIYFSLKDENSQISCVLFGGSASRLKRLPKDGDQITIEGEISLYAPRGTYQIIVRKVTYDGVGDLLMKLYALKETLQKEGYFDPSQKQILPRFPKAIGVVTSPTGAVIQDILHILKRRFPGIRVILNPVSVQGEGAAADIANAIDEFNRHQLVDVLIIGRGGGSLEDLWAFNERVVADAIYRSKIPTISAVGHETDFSIADFVADVRAPTPSAAAELVVPEKDTLIKQLHQGRDLIANLTHGQIQQARLKLDKIAHQPVIRDPCLLTLPYTQRIDTMTEDLGNAIEQKLQVFRLNLGAKRQRFLGIDPKQLTQIRREKLNSLSSHLNSLNPKAVLKKGYSIVFRENKNSVIVSSKDLEIGESLSVQFSDSVAKVKVEGNV